MQRLVFFSIDAIVDTSALQLRAFNAAFSELGFEWRWSEEDFDTLRNIAGERHRISWFAEHYHGHVLSVGMADKIHWQKKRALRTLLEGDCARPYPGVVRLLNEAASTNVSANLFLPRQGVELDIYTCASRSIGALSSLRLERNQTRQLHHRSDTHAGKDKGAYKFRNPNAVVTVEKEIKLGLNHKVARECFNVTSGPSGGQACVNHFGDPDNHAVQISGTHVLNRGIVSVKSLTML